MRKQFRHVLLCHFSYQLRPDELVGVHDDVPGTDDARPRNLRVLPMKGVIQFAGSFADDCDVAADSVHNQRLRSPVVAAGNRVLRDTAAGIADVHDVDERVLGWHRGYRGIASVRTRSRMYGWMQPDSTRSTLTPSKSWRSERKPPISSSPRPFSRSTRKSTSLPGLFSHEATDPNTRTLRQPCNSARRRISALLSTRSMSSVITLTLLLLSIKTSAYSTAKPSVFGLIV